MPFYSNLLAVTPSLSASAQEAIKIGSSLGLTGYGSLTDGHWRDGLELAIAAVNAKGGVLGKKLSLVYEDNKSTPQEAVVVYRKMMSENKVVAFDSGCISAGNFAAASFVTRPSCRCPLLGSCRGCPTSRSGLQLPAAAEVRGRLAL
jgi:hypothetical protein